MKKILALLFCLVTAPASAQQILGGFNLSGNPPAASIGNEGQYYIDMTSGKAYGPKTSGQWGTSSTSFTTIPNSISQNLFYASPNGSTGAATFRSIAVPDLPTTGYTTQAQGDTSTAPATDAFVYANPTVGFRNRLINGDMVIDQRNNGAAQTITGGAALAYTVDRWYAYSTGANVTGQQIASTGITGSPAKSAYQFTGAASVTGIGFCQRIESFNSYDLANGNATLSVLLSDSLLTTVNWQIWYANSNDTFGSLALPTVTSISSGSFTVTSSLAKYTTTIAVPSAATTGLQICFSVGAQTSGTFTIGNAQLEPGAAATSFERIPWSVQLARSQYYYRDPAFGQASTAYTEFQYNTAGQTATTQTITFPPMRNASFTITTRNVSYANGSALTVSAQSRESVTVGFTATAAGAADAYFNLALSAEL